MPVRMGEYGEHARTPAHFWGLVDRSGGPGTCWEWRGTRYPNGYGHFGGRFYAHRHALSLTIGRELEPGEQACHRCNNRSCCNPEHLYVGTAATNGRDRRMWGSVGKKYQSA